MEWSEYSFVLKPSVLGGVGVFSVHDIPAGVLVLRSSFELRLLKVKEIPKEFLQYCIYINDSEVLGPERFDRMEIGWFINHSDEPNIARHLPLKNAGSADLNRLIADMKVRSLCTVRDVKAGDEILIDYHDLDEPEHLKEEYYKVCARQ